MRRHLLVIGALSLLTSIAGRGQTPGDHATAHAAPTATKSFAIRNCFDLCRSSQWTRRDIAPEYAGAFLSKDDGRYEGAPVEFEQYLSAHVALALLHAYESDVYAEPADLDRVRRWLLFCVRIQSPEGYFPVYSNAGPTGIVPIREVGVDAWDSSAAMFLLVVWKYELVGGRVPVSVRNAADRAFECLERCFKDSPDELAFNFPLNDGDPATTSVRFLADNVEVYGGLVAAERYFRSAGDVARARRCATLYRGVAKGLTKFWRPSERLFAWAIQNGPDGADVFSVDDTLGDVVNGESDHYPEGLAQTLGVAYIAPRIRAWNVLVRAYGTPPSDLSETAASERWLGAAHRISPDTRVLWRDYVIDEASQFRDGYLQAVYVVRPAVAAMTLLKGPDWIPNPSQARSSKSEDVLDLFDSWADDETNLAREFAGEAAGRSPRSFDGALAYVFANDAENCAEIRRAYVDSDCLAEDVALRYRQASSNACAVRFAFRHFAESNEVAAREAFESAYRAYFWSRFAER